MRQDWVEASGKGLIIRFWNNRKKTQKSASKKQMQLLQGKGKERIGSLEVNCPTKQTPQLLTRSACSSMAADRAGRMADQRKSRRSRSQSPSPEHAQESHHRQRPRRLHVPSGTAEPHWLCQHYCHWYLGLIKKAYRLCIGRARPLTADTRRRDAPLKHSLDAWEQALLGWLSEPWMTTLNKAQFDAIYDVLYHVAFRAFWLNAGPNDSQSCQAAVEATVRLFLPCIKSICADSMVCLYQLSVTPVVLHNRVNDKLRVEKVRVVPPP